MQGFQQNLTSHADDMTKYSRNNMQKLDFKNIQYLMKYEYFYEIYIIGACANCNKTLFA